MRILIEALGTSRYGGGRTATFGLLRGLIEFGDENEYVVLVDRFEPLIENAPPNFRQIVAPLNNRFLARIWAQSVLPGFVQHRKIDLVHFAKNLVVFGLPCPTVVTVYDMTIMRFPHLFPWIDVCYWRTLQPFALKYVHSIISISMDTAQDLDYYYHIPRERITVVYPSIASAMMPPSPSDVAGVWQKYSLPPRCILHVGSLAKKKNLSTLVRAFSILTREYHYDGQLVFAGTDYRSERDDDFYKLIGTLNLRESIRFLGAVSEMDLPALYSRAQAVAYVSLHEGFGLVALEALSCGAAMIVSSGGALPEVVGDASVVLPEVNDPRAVAAELWEVVSNDVLNRQLREHAIERAKVFSIKRNANEMLAVYRRVI